MSSFVRPFAILDALNMASTEHRVDGDYTATAQQVADLHNAEHRDAYAFALSRQQVGAHLGLLGQQDGPRPPMVERTAHGGWALTQAGARWLLMLAEPAMSPDRQDGTA